MKKIVFINQATGYLTIDILNEFAQRFNDVALITGSVRVQDDELNSKIKVSKVVKYNRGSNLKKASSWILGTIQIYLLLLFKYRGYEKVFFTIPPTAYLLPLTGRRFSIIIYDLYPDALKINGFKSDSWLYRWWIRRNQRIFPKAYKVYTLSDNMKDLVLNYAENVNVEVIPNWSAFSNYKPIKKEENSLLLENSLHDKFIVQYSGNIGATHNVEVIIELADKLRGHKNIVFQIIGRGVRTETIAEMIDQKQLDNCSLLPFRPDEVLYESLCSASLAIVTLDDRTADVSVPSKTYNLMSAGVPIMAIAVSSSSLANIISEFELGEAFEKDEIDGMSEFILNLLNNQSYLKELRHNSFKASNSFSKANASRYLNSYLSN